MLSHSLIKKTLKSRGFQQSSLNIVGNLTASAFSALAIILITRALGPANFGEFSVGFSMVLILTRLNEFGLNTAVVKFASIAQSNAEKKYIFHFTKKYKILGSSIIFFLAFLLFQPIANFFELKHPMIVLIACTIGISTVYFEQLQVSLQSLHLFGKAVFINFLQAFSKFISAIILTMISVATPVLHFFLYALSPLVPVFFQNKILPKEVLQAPNIVFREKDPQIFNLAKHSSIALICAGIIENIDILFLQYNLSSYETGLYSGVSRIALLFSLVAYSLGDVLNARVARYSAKQDIQGYLKKSFLIAICCIGIFLMVLPFTRFLIIYTIGSAYLSSLPILIILLASSFIAIIAMAYIALFYTFKLNWYFSISGILQLIVILIGNFIFVPQYGLEAAAITRLAARVVLLVFTLIAARIYYLRVYAHKLT